MRAIFTYTVVFFSLLTIDLGLIAQNNVGINTRNPDLTSITHIDDSVRGFLLPRTDTQAIWNYVNSLTPNPGITHGLTIYETNMRTIYIYNGLKQKWEPISSLTGARGIVGPTGPRGGLGPMGISTQWRDSALFDPVKKLPKTTNIPPYFTQLGDTCGDFYHQTATGLLWTYDCDSSKWVGPIARWRNFGAGIMYDIQHSGVLEITMSTDSTLDAISLLGDLSFTLEVPPDTVAHVFIISEGTCIKSKRNDTAYNTMVFDFLVDSNGVGSYMGSQNTITVSPNFLVTASNCSQFDKAPWKMSMAGSFEGQMSPPRNPLPATAINTYKFETHVGQYYRDDNPVGINGKVLVSDGGASLLSSYEAYSHMNIYVIFERSKNAPYPY